MIRLIVCLILISSEIYSQTSEEVFTMSIIRSIDSFSKISNEKYKAIKGVYIEFDTSRNLIKYHLTFSNNKIRLSKHEYNCLFGILQRQVNSQYLKENYYSVLSNGKIKISLPIKISSVTKYKKDLR